MPQAPETDNEEERLRCLETFEILDTATDEAFQDVVKVASQICGTPIALISLVDKTRQWFLAERGLGVRETPKEQAFCGYTILGNELLVVPDSLKDRRFADNALVLGHPHIRFYAGAPLIAASGHRLGSLCVIDSQPRELSVEQAEALGSLSKVVVSLIERRQLSGRLTEALARVERRDALVKKSEQRFQAVFDSQRQLVGIVNLSGDLEIANLSGVEAAGAPRGTYLGQALWALPLWQHDLAVRESIRESVKRAGSGESVRMETTYFAYGAMHWSHFSLVPFRDSDGQVLFLVAEVHDITELKQTQQALEELNCQKNLLLGMAAHDLRNPLAVILGYTKFIRNRCFQGVPEKVLGFIESIEMSAQNMLGLVEDLLDVATFESGKLTLNKETFDLRLFLREAIELNQPLAEAKQISLETCLPENPVHLQGDLSKLNQVLTNLVTNAIKFSKPNTSIAISLVLHSDRAEVHVRDQGPGLSPKVQELLFQPFGRAPGVQPTSGERSTGLGLAIARRIIEGHQGAIGVSSQVGSGSDFWFSLPLNCH